jgi:NAD(P)-dependent dehydrogenase (short-subunit alcohol dehydrogenase family)
MRRGGHGAAVDVLINSAGIFDDKPLEQVTADDLRRMYEVNVIGLFITTQAVLARMPDGGASSTSPPAPASGSGAPSISARPAGCPSRCAWFRNWPSPGWPP